MSEFRPMITASQRAKIDKREVKMGIDESLPWPENISFNVEQLPQIKKWEVGKEYQISLKVRMDTYEDRRGKDKPPKVTARFEILAVRADSELSKEQKKVMKRMGVEE